VSVLRLGARVLGVALAVSFVALLAYGLLSRSPDTTIDDSLAAAEPAPAPGFELPILLAPRPVRGLGSVLADDRVSLRELRGRPVVLNLWASWCLPCREEAPVLERAWRRQGPGGAVFVGVDQQDITGDALAFLRELGVTYLNVRDRGNDVARSYGATGLPETFFISRRGAVVGHVIGVVSADQLRRGIEAARTGRTLGVRDGGERRPAASR
jgi:cytochrome c biogenesis protein CcmG/thiol:disulfide interchange protein DsbE